MALKFIQGKSQPRVLLWKKVALDRLSEDYLFTKAIATHKTPTELISELVQERIAASVDG